MTAPADNSNRSSPKDQKATPMDALLSTSNHIVNSTDHTVSGRGLANRKSYDQLLSMAADYKNGQLKVEPSCKQACALFGVSPADLRRELKRRAGANGKPLSDGAAYLANVWAATYPVDREAAFKEIGPAEIWDTIARVVA